MGFITETTERQDRWQEIRGRRNKKYITSACKNFGTSAYGELWRAEKKKNRRQCGRL